MSTELIARIETLSKSNKRLLTAAPLATSEKLDSSNLEISQIHRIQKLSEMLADEVSKTLIQRFSEVPDSEIPNFRE